MAGVHRNKKLKEIKGCRLGIEPVSAIYLCFQSIFPLLLGLPPVDDMPDFCAACNATPNELHVALS